MAIRAIYRVHPLTLFRWTPQATTTPLKDVWISPNGLPAPGNRLLVPYLLPKLARGHCCGLDWDPWDRWLIGSTLRIRHDHSFSIRSLDYYYVALTVVG
jgi:hypothetical protein